MLRITSKDQILLICKISKFTITSIVNISIEEEILHISEILYTSHNVTNRKYKWNFTNLQIRKIENRKVSLILLRKRVQIT